MAPDGFRDLIQIQMLAEPVPDQPARLATNATNSVTLFEQAESLVKPD